MPEQHGPSEFGEILNSPERPLIVGGQAVNIWAEYFAPRNAWIDAQRPFVSKDADIFGDRAMAQRLADAAGWEIKFFHEPRTIAVAALVKRRPDAETLTVEVLREVRGLTRKELSDSDLVELRPGHIYRIPSPIRLLKAKLANLLQIKPTRTNDVYHVRLLVSLTHDYLGDQHAQVSEQHLTERALINALHELREVITAAGCVSWLRSIISIWHQPCRLIFRLLVCQSSLHSTSTTKESRLNEITQSESVSNPPASSNLRSG